MQYAKQSDASFDEINTLIWKHLEERDWLGGKPRNYATSIAVEAAELLEHFQWTDESTGNKEELASELADILIYCFQFAMHTNIDMAEAIKHKLVKASEKYPTESFKNKTPAERRVNWLEAHKQHRAARKDS